MAVYTQTLYILVEEERPDCMKIVMNEVAVKTGGPDMRIFTHTPSAVMVYDLSGLIKGQSPDLTIRASYLHQSAGTGLLYPYYLSKTFIPLCQF